MGTHIGFDPRSHHRQTWMDPYAARVDLRTLFIVVRSGPAMAIAARKGAMGVEDEHRRL
jgi:hypothetical protein